MCFLEYLMTESRKEFGGMLGEYAPLAGVVALILTMGISDFGIRNQELFRLLTDQGTFVKNAPYHLGPISL